MRPCSPKSAVPSITRKRTQQTKALFVIILGVLMLRLASIQLFARRAPDYTREEVLEPRRGDIYSRNRVLLAISVDATSIAVNPRAVNKPDELVDLLASTLKMPKSEIREKLSRTVNKKNNKPNFFVWIQRKVSDEAAAHIRRESKARKLEGLEFRTEGKREYPQGAMACQLLGFANVDGKGIEGLEAYSQNTLGGKPGAMQAEVDARGVPIPGGLKKLVPAVDGEDLVLTIDEKIQSFAEAALAECVAKYTPNWAGAFVLRPRTGELLACAIKPDFNLNQFARSRPEWRANRAVSFTYEPGSTFKVVVASGVVEERAASSHQTFNCPGETTIGGRRIHCWIQGVKGHGHGPQKLEDAITNSCNIAMARFGKCLGDEKLDYYAREFGFCRPTQLGCPHEKRGWMDPVDRWSEVQLANLSFGQSIAVTPVQLLCAFAALANDGLLLRPYVVKEACSKEGRVLQQYGVHPVRRVVSPETAQRVLDMMKQVVDEGTGKLAAVMGYPVAGKTGSAQKAFGPHGFAPGKFVSSFCGIVPANNPELAILVVVDEPRGCHWGSTVCGPVFKDIAVKSLWRLGVRPTRRMEQPQQENA